VYWTGGKQGWETWRIRSDSINQGLIAGLGDGAYFSELLPSLLLKNDTLVEMEMSMVPDPKRKFRGLAMALLSRL
jgi:hypothetical protein